MPRRSARRSAQHLCVLSMTRRLSLADATDLAERASRAAGASDEAAQSLARATVSADAHRKSSIGFAHLLDYLAAFREGRIDGGAEPPGDFASAGGNPLRRQRRDRAARLRPRLRRSAQPGRDLRYRVVRARRQLHHGELGYYPRRLAEAGLVAFAATNGPALIAVPGARTPSIHQSARLRRAARRRAAVAHRPGVERDRLCPSLGTMPSAAKRCRPAGRSTPMDSRPPILTRRSAARCWRSAGRGAPISR